MLLNVPSLEVCGVDVTITNCSLGAGFPGGKNRSCSLPIQGGSRSGLLGAVLSEGFCGAFVRRRVLISASVSSVL